jgi:hypothetical protein
VDDDVFLDHITSSIPQVVTFVWQHKTYQVTVPEGAVLPCFLTVGGVEDAPPGDLVVVLRRNPGVRDLLGEPQVFQATVQVTS